MRSSPRGATPSPPPPRGRLSVTSRRSSATSPWTSSRRCPLPPPPPPWRSPTSCPTARSSPSATRGSGAPRLSSSPASWAWRPAASTRPPTTPSLSATLTSGRTCTPTPSCPEAPPCTPVLLTACRRRSPPWLPPPSRSRSSLPPRGSTPSGSEKLEWTTSMGTELKTIWIMSLEMTEPSWIHLSYWLGVSGFSLMMLTIHCITFLSSSRSLLVLMGLLFAMGRAGRLSVLVIGKPPTAFTSTISFLLVTGLGTGAGWEGEEDEEASEIRERLLSSEGLAEGTQDLVVLGGDRRSLDSPPMLSFLDTVSGPLGSV